MKSGAPKTVKIPAKRPAFMSEDKKTGKTEKSNKFLNFVDGIKKSFAGGIKDPHFKVGGGRLIGEACHFLDLLIYLSGSTVKDISLCESANLNKISDNFSIQIKFANGSIGTVHYFSHGSKLFPKERLEVFADGKVVRLDNFLKIKTWGLSKNENKRMLKQDKGHFKMVKKFPKNLKIKFKK